MLCEMRIHFADVQAEIAKGSRADEKRVKEAMRAASAVAKDLAPYFHARLSAVQVDQSHTLDLTKCTDEQLQWLIEIRRTQQLPAPGDDPDGDASGGGSSGSGNNGSWH